MQKLDTIISTTVGNKSIHKKLAHRKLGQPKFMRFIEMCLKLQLSGRNNKRNLVHALCQKLYWSSASKNIQTRLIRTNTFALNVIKASNDINTGD